MKNLITNQFHSEQLRQLLAVPAESEIILERYSDSVATFVLLDSDNLAIYKQLYRAAKAKLKLRIRVTTVIQSPSDIPKPNIPPLPETAISHEQIIAPVDSATQRYSYLETVLSPPLPPRSTNAATTSTISEAPSSVSEKPITGNASETSLSSNEPKPIPVEPAFVDVPKSPKFYSSPFSIECNYCGRCVLNEHYHCSICDDGDYDLCVMCIQAGVYCLGQDHWMIKRCVQDGKVVNSTTERIAPRRQTPSGAAEPDVVDSKSPATSATLNSDSAEPKAENQVNEERTCNGCFKCNQRLIHFSPFGYQLEGVLTAYLIDQDVARMVTCSDCQDYDLCVTCLLKDKHGHHPAHVFTLVQDRDFCLRSLVQSRCRPGRHFHHAAICDGCNKRIVGVRHKCLTCPDWDFCWRCIETANTDHPGHRFAPVYSTLAEVPVHAEIHSGIFCDGPLCQGSDSQMSIVGLRYKCAVCHDTDFCAACEAHPKNKHNRSHPLIKFATPVRSVSVSTYSDDRLGGPVRLFGDLPQSSALPLPDEVDCISSYPADDFGLDAKSETSAEPKLVIEETAAQTEPTSTRLDYNALFEGETVPDGTEIAPGIVFQQSWTLRNPGPSAWPAGSSVRFVGGDSMFNVDDKHPSSIEAITFAMESNQLITPLAPGETAEFTVILKAPLREGTSISYWRLKLPDGTPFGHKLWCDIQVKDPVSAEKAERPLTRSDMVFPELEKESPVASVHEELTPAAPHPSITATAAPSVSNADSQSILDDVESLTLEDAETGDEEFLTDEEYDILDASDHEFTDRQ